MIFDSRTDLNLHAAVHHGVTTLELDGMFCNMKNGTYSLGALMDLLNPVFTKGLTASFCKSDKML